MKKIFFLLVVVFTLLMGSTAFANGDNLVQNPGFEQGSLDKWEKGAYDSKNGVTEFKLDDTVSYSGSKSACIINNSPNDARYKQKIKVNGNSYYKLSCWVKAENIGSEFKGANISVDGILDTSTDVRGNSDWQYVELYGSTKKGQKDLIVTIGLGGYGNTNTGKAWFDDVVVEKVDKLPSGVNVAKFYVEEAPKELIKLPTSKNISFMTPYTIVFFIVAALLIVLAKKNIIKIKPNQEKKLLFIFLGIGLLIRLIAAPIIEGFSVDIGCFTAWSAKAASTNGISTFYTSGMFCDYPPFYILVLSLVGHISNFIQSIFRQSPNLLLIKLPPILADVATSYLFYKIAAKRFKPTVGVILSILYLFNPVVFVNSTLWGQVDSFFTFLLLLGLLLIDSDRLRLATVIFTIAVLMKPQGIIFLPVIGYELIIDFLKTKNFKNIGLSMLYAIITTAIIILPFSAGRAPTWLIDLYINTAEGYKYASMNAYNLFSLLGANAKEDSNILYILSYYQWGMIFIVLTSLFTGFLYFANFIKKSSLKIAPIAAMIQMTGVFVLSSRMHERYLFPSIAFALLAYIYYKDIGYLILFGGFSATVFVNTYDVLVRMFLTESPYIPANDTVLFIGSLANVLLLVILCIVSIQTVIRNKTILFDFKSGSDTVNPAIANKKATNKKAVRKN